MVDIKKKQVIQEVPPTTTHITDSQPVLDKVETRVHKDIIEKEHVLETRRRDEIEVHERPIIREVLHPEREIHVKEQALQETIGLPEAERQREQLLSDLRRSDASHPVTYEEKSQVQVEHMAPTIQQERLVNREIIEKPIVTEVHHQPVREVHERDVHKTVYEQPEVRVVREAPIVETVSTTQFVEPTTVTEPVRAETVIVQGPTTTTEEHSTTFGEKLHNLKENIKEKLHLGHSSEQHKTTGSPSTTTTTTTTTTRKL